MRRLILICFLFFVQMTHSEEPDLHFANAEMKTQYQSLLKEIRCVTCPNQSLSDSTMPVAMGMKWEIYQQLQEEKSPQDIKAYFVLRYGKSVLYRPLFDKSTLVLWCGPAFFVLMMLFIWRKKMKNKT